MIEKSVADGLEVVKKRKRQDPEDTRELNLLWQQVNALFLDRKTEFSPDFLRRVAAGLGASGYQVDFARDSNGSRAAVNAFVAKQTRGLIDPILGEKVVSRETGLMALSTLWLRFTWICEVQRNPNEFSFKGKNGETRFRLR